MLAELLVAGALALVFLFFCWRLDRGAGVVLNAWRLFVYGVLFMLGEGYLTFLIRGLKWPRVALFGAIAGWGTLLLCGEWYRRQRHRDHSELAKK